ncbi:MAG: ABC transporter ATP-binding protein [Rhodoferax sp.]
MWLRGVCLQRAGTPIVQGVDLQLAVGQRVGILGPNGAGKSSLLELISGSVAPTAGQIWLHGQRIDTWSMARRARAGLGRSHQVSQLFDTLTVYENLATSLYRTCLRRSQFLSSQRAQAGLHSQVQTWLDRLGLTPWATQPASQLGYAQRRLLELGLALAANARVLLLDEPTAGLSLPEAQQLAALLGQWLQGRTLLVVEHDLAVLRQLCDTLVLLQDGRIQMQGPVDAVLASPAWQAVCAGVLPAATPVDGCAPC